MSADKSMSISREITVRQHVTASLPPAPEAERFAGIAIGEHGGAVVVIGCDLALVEVAPIERAWPHFASAVLKILRAHRPSHVTVAGSREAASVAIRVGRLEGLAMASCGVMAGALTLREICARLQSASPTADENWDAIQLAKGLFPGFLAPQPSVDSLTYAAALLAAASARLTAY